MRTEEFILRRLKMKRKRWNKEQKIISAVWSRKKKSVDQKAVSARYSKSCPFLGDRPCTKENVILYKLELQEKYRPSAVNTKLAALNGFFPL